MSSPIAMQDLGNDVYLSFTLRDIAQLQSEYDKTPSHYLSMNDPGYIVRALFHGLKRSDGIYINQISPYGPLNLDDIPVPLSTLKARIQYALQPPLTG